MDLDIEKKRGELVEALARSTITATLAAVHPVLGPLAAGVIGLIPERRAERMRKALLLLARKTEDVDRDLLEQRFLQPSFGDLLEEGMLQAACAFTEERIEHLSSLLAKGLRADELEEARLSRLLHLIGQINDVEVLLLASYIPRLPEDQRKFQELHSETLFRRPDLSNMPLAEIDDARFHESYRDRLVDLRLLDRTYKRPKKGELPEFDPATGQMKAQGLKLATLGRLLLRGIDLIADEDET